MPLESNPQTIADLDQSWPVGGDPTTQGDDQLRNLKRVLQNIFPDGADGPGFDSPVLATVVELNYLTGVDANIQESLEALRVQDETTKQTLYAPDDAVMLWFDPVPPAGWRIQQELPSVHMVAVGPSVSAGQLSGESRADEWAHSHAVQPFTIGAQHLPEHAHKLTLSPDGANRFLTYAESEVVQHAHVAEDVVGNNRDGGYTYGVAGVQNLPVDGAVTASATWKPYIAHSVPIVRDSSLDA